MLRASQFLITLQDCFPSFAKMSCCLQPEAERRDEHHALIESSHQRFRQGREKRVKSRTEKIAASLMKIAYCTAGYWVPSSCCYFYVILLLMLSSFQLVYDLFTVFKFPNFDCRFLVDNKINTNPMRKAQNAAYTLASFGGLFSYVFMILTLYIANSKMKNALSPWSIKNDLSKKNIYSLIFLFFAISLCYVATVSIFYYLVRGQISARSKFILLATGVGSQLITQWTGIVACFVFGATALALGTFSEDFVRRIKEVKTINVNSPIAIHREFAEIVSDTVDSFALWFVFHWLLYGLTTIMALVVVTAHFGEEHTVMKKIYISLFFFVHLFMFVFPCACAAYITSTCSGVLSKLNNTREEDWEDDHIFKDRTKLQLFITYARDSSVGFKIGRITFTSTLAWISLFIGSSGLLFRFF